MEGTVHEIKDIERVTKAGAELVKDSESADRKVYTRVYKKITTNSPTTINIIRFWFDERSNKASVKITHTSLALIVAIGTFTATVCFAEGIFHILSVL